jgi:hypothetical protein
VFALDAGDLLRDAGAKPGGNDSSINDLGRHVRSLKLNSAMGAGFRTK